MVFRAEHLEPGTTRCRTCRGGLIEDGGAPDCNKTRKKLGRKNKTAFRELVVEMVESNIRAVTEPKVAAVSKSS